MQGLAHFARDDRKIVADKIKRGVTDESGFKDLPAHLRIEPLRLLPGKQWDVLSLIHIFSTGVSTEPDDPAPR